MISYKDRLKSLRSLTKVVGVVGMNASGKLEFAKRVWNAGGALFGNENTEANENLATLFENVTSKRVAFLNHVATTSNISVETVSEMNMVDLLEVIRETPGLYEYTMNDVFEDSINYTLDKVREILAIGVTYQKSSCLFIECSVADNVKYHDLFDEVVIIERPTNYVAPNWYMDYYLQSNHFDASPSLTEIGTRVLQKADAHFKNIKAITPYVINNNSTLSAFQETADSVIEELFDRFK